MLRKSLSCNVPTDMAHISGERQKEANLSFYARKTYPAPGEIPTVLVTRQRCEFVGPRDVQPLFGMPADFARSLFLRGLIRAVLLKRPGQ